MSSVVYALFWMWLGAVATLGIKRALDTNARRRLAPDISRALRRDRRRKVRLTLV